MAQELLNPSIKFNKVLFREDSLILGDEHLEDNFDAGTDILSEFPLIHELMMVEHVFAHVSPIGPPSGFTNRWQQTLERSNRKVKIRQVGLLLSLFGGTALVIFLLLFTHLLVDVHLLPARLLAWFADIPEIVGYTSSLVDQVLWQVAVIGRSLVLSWILIPLSLMVWLYAWSLGLIWLVFKKRDLLHNGLHP